MKVVDTVGVEEVETIQLIEKVNVPVEKVEEVV